MNEMINRQEAGLPAGFLDKLSKGIADSKATTVVGGGGKPLLRMLKSGEWVFGQTNEEVQPGSRWVVNVYSLQHGWSCWVETQGKAKNELRGETMVSWAEPKPPCPPPIDGTPYKEQRAMALKCLDGADAGIEVLHKVASIGGMTAILDLVDRIQIQIAKDRGHPCAVLQLGHDYYEHSKWGRIYTPIYDIVGWADMDGNVAGEAAGAIAAPAAPQAAKPKKAPLQAASPAAAPAEPVPTQQVHAGQRRRPAAR